MLILAYIFLIAALAWAFSRRRRSWLQRLASGMQDVVRLCLLLLALVGVAGGAWGIQLRLVEEGEMGVQAWLPLVLFVTLTLGAALYAAGVIAWRGSRALLLRRVGWILAVTVLVVPSTLTLAFPLAALLMIGLELVPRRRLPSPSVVSA